MKNKILESDKKIALICGGLLLPFLARDALKKHGFDVFVIGLKNFYDKDLKPDLVVRIGAGGTVYRECKKRGIKKLAFVGAIGHPNLLDIRPDLWSVSILLSVLKNQKGYDSMAVALNKAIEKKGFQILAVQDLAPELTFEKKGILTKTKPNKKDKIDIYRAVEVSHLIGKSDIGASVVVDGQVIAIEAAEGTAKMLDRVIQIRNKKSKISGVFAKMTKPNQDLRIDIPAIGVDTIKSLKSAKIKGLVVNSKTCFVINKDEVLNLANKNKMFIVSV